MRILLYITPSGVLLSHILTYLALIMGRKVKGGKKAHYAAYYTNYKHGGLNMLFSLFVLVGVATVAVPTILVVVVVVAAAAAAAATAASAASNFFRQKVDNIFLCFGCTICTCFSVSLTGTDCTVRSTCT